MTDKGLIHMDPLIPIEKNEREILRFLIQLYRYDLSEFRGCILTSKNKFFEGDLERRCISGEALGWLISDEAGVAGFVILTPPTENNTTWELNDFFVMRSRRRRGTGSNAARAAFALGNSWALCVDVNNPGANKFWTNLFCDCSLQVISRSEIKSPTTPVDSIRYIVEKQDNPAR